MAVVKGWPGSPPSSFLSLFIFLRETETAQVREGQRDRGKERESQADSALPVQSSMWGSNPRSREIMTWAETKSCALALLSHTGAPCSPPSYSTLVQVSVSVIPSTPPYHMESLVPVSRSDVSVFNCQCEPTMEATKEKALRWEETTARLRQLGSASWRGQLSSAVDRRHGWVRNGLVLYQGSGIWYCLFLQHTLAFIG